jgi:hypothetical protein
MTTDITKYFSLEQIFNITALIYLWNVCKEQCYAVMQRDFCSSPKADVSVGSRPSHSTQELEHERVIGLMVSRWVLLLWMVRGRVEELPAQVSPGRGR